MPKVTKFKKVLYTQIIIQIVSGMKTQTQLAYGATGAYGKKSCIWPVICGHGSVLV